MSTPVFEQVEIGARLDGLHKGPLGTAHLVRWSAAMENWHRIHYDHAFATQHDKLPGLVINGSLKQQFLLEMLRRWAGPQGWVRKVTFQFRAMNLVGETLCIWGQVLEKRVEADQGIVCLDIGITNDQGMESTPGRAEIALPLAGKPPLPRPYRSGAR